MNDTHKCGVIPQGEPHESEDEDSGSLFAGAGSKTGTQAVGGTTRAAVRTSLPVIKSEVVTLRVVLMNEGQQCRGPHPATHVKGVGPVGR